MVVFVVAVVVVAAVDVVAVVVLIVPVLVVFLWPLPQHNQRRSLFWFLSIENNLF